MMAHAGNMEGSCRETGALIARYANGRNIKQIVNEWNLFYGADVIQSGEGAVYASRAMNGFERAGELVASNAISDLLNGWMGGVIQATRDRVYGTLQYYAIKMYNDHLGTDRLAAQVQSPELRAGVSSVDAVATRSADGSQVFVKMSNADRSHAVPVSIQLGGFAASSEARIQTLSAAGAVKRNSFAQPDAVKPVEKPLRCPGACTVQLPADAVAVVTFHKERQ